MKIVKYSDPILRKKCKEVKKEDFNKELITSMFDFCRLSGGIGLAAPQIGKDIRIFVINYGIKKAFINPRVSFIGEDINTSTEGCLSLSGSYKVNRHNSVRIQYVDENWNNYDEIYEGYMSRIIQHEYDHLDGILIIDRKI